MNTSDFLPRIKRPIPIQIKLPMNANAVSKVPNATSPACKDSVGSKTESIVNPKMNNIPFITNPIIPKIIMIFPITLRSPTSIHYP